MRECRLRSPVIGNACGRDALLLHVDWRFNADEVEADLIKLVAANDAPDSTLRLCVFRSEGGFWAGAGSGEYLRFGGDDERPTALEGLGCARGFGKTRASRRPLSPEQRPSHGRTT